MCCQVQRFIFIIFIGTAPISFSQSYWEKRKEDFYWHYTEYNQYKNEKFNAKQNYIQQKNKNKIQKNKQHEHYIKNRTKKQNHKAQMLFQTFLEKKSTSNLKEAFLKKRAIKNKIKNKHKIPQENIFFDAQ